MTDIGSGTDDLVSYVSTRAGLGPKDYSKIAAGAGQTMIAALKFNKAVCGITSQPTVNAIEKLKVGYSAIDLSTGAGAQKWLGGDYPAASVLVQADWLKDHQKEAQGVVNALVATLAWMKTHTAADVADVMPKDFVSNQLTSKDEYIAALQGGLGPVQPRRPRQDAAERAADRLRHPEGGRQGHRRRRPDQDLHRRLCRRGSEARRPGEVDRTTRGGSRRPSSTRRGNWLLQSTVQ